MAHGERAHRISNNRAKDYQKKTSELKRTFFGFKSVRSNKYIKRLTHKVARQIRKNYDRKQQEQNNSQLPKPEQN